MRPTRRRFLHLGVGSLTFPAISRFALAQDYPTRPVRLIVAYPPGSAADVLARLMGQWLSDRLGQPFVIENRPGGSTNIATQAAVNASPDGYTLLMVHTAGAVNATLYDKLTYNFIRDIAPIAGLGENPLVMEVNPSVPVETLPEFIAYAKSNPGKLNMASAGTGGASHISGELFKMMTGVNLVYVPYAGGPPAITDLLTGQVHVLFDAISSSIGHIRTGRLRALAVTTAKRQQTLPDIPPIGDFVPGYEASGWHGIGAPRSTPTDILNKLNKEINAALADPKIKARLLDLGSAPMPMTPEEFGRFIVSETEKWGKVVRFAGLKPS
jgi:tripartite-type tricarboxylate transporter receptor subunit TctC